MKYYIFRNQTIEPFFGNKDVSYSGYGEIGSVPTTADVYLWFYQVPIGCSSAIAQEVKSFFDRLQFVIQQIPKGKTIIVFTLLPLANTSLIDSDHELRLAIIDFNAKVMKLSHENSLVKYVDFEEFINRYPINQCVNWKFYFISQMVLNPKLAKEFDQWWQHKESSIALQRKKCLVLDLDNTLWGGVLGEVGATGIQIGGEYPGNAFALWQSALLELSKTGIMLAICSKNNEADVFEAWDNNPFIILKREHFVAWQINWQDKATNLKKLATTLNIGLDSMVFLDDNPTERELIKQMLPDVVVPDFPERPYELMSFFDSLVNRYFRVYSVTKEDLSKTEQYKTNAQRASQLSQFVDFESYLRSLDLHLTIEPINDFNLSRIAQMTQKTNQFNLTTIRRTESEINQLRQNGALIYCISVSDKFGDSGITGEIILQPLENGAITIDTFLLSCRILGKGIETAFLHTILNLLQHRGFTHVLAQYDKSLKNSQVADFYECSGFHLISQSGTRKQYKLLLNKQLPIKDYYTITLNK